MHERNIAKNLMILIRKTKRMTIMIAESHGEFRFLQFVSLRFVSYLVAISNIFQSLCLSLCFTFNTFCHQCQICSSDILTISYFIFLSSVCVIIINFFPLAFYSTHAHMLRSNKLQCTGEAFIIREYEMIFSRQRMSAQLGTPGATERLKSFNYFKKSIL